MLHNIVGLGLEQQWHWWPALMAVLSVAQHLQENMPVNMHKTVTATSYFFPVTLNGFDIEHWQVFNKCWRNVLDVSML